MPLAWSRPAARKLIAALVLVVLVSAAVIALRPSEPWHKGKPLSFWLDQLPMIEVHPPTGGSSHGWGGSSRGLPFRYSELSEEEIKVVVKRGREAEATIADIDTNAFPAIVARLGRSESKIEVTIRRWLQILDRLGWDVPYRNLAIYEQRAQALQAIEILRPRAKSIIPDLIRLSKSDDPEIKASARYALDQIFPEEVRKMPSEIAIPMVRVTSPEEQQKIRETDIQYAKNEWRTPIDFYGKTVDQNGEPISGANILFTWNNLSGSHSRQVTSDASGLFEIRGEQGKALTVRTSKEGYYAEKDYPVGFFYAGQNENFVSDRSNPVVSRLRKRGVAEPLVVCKQSFRVAKDGTPFGLDLIRCRKATDVGNADLVVECWTDNAGLERGAKYPWKCRISVPGGGIKESEVQFDFVAPPDGYHPDWVFQMSPTNSLPRWVSKTKQKFQLRLKNNNFARVTFEIIAANDHFFEIESYLNPSGSRNLEFAPAAQPKQTVFE